MRTISVFNNVTLDGVMQAPAGKDEDTHGRFRHGGWALPYNDSVKGSVAAEGMANSTLLSGDAADSVAKLKQQPGDDLTLLGSGELIRSLMKRDLIDQFILLIQPLVLGSGQRLFDDGGAFARFRLEKSQPTTTGVVIATYELAKS